ncbi:class F sortase [Candidatus Daviesbacteria bacterium]|nr:class F sortase [Candidatus Daviesbacteria bacterium]
MNVAWSHMMKKLSVVLIVLIFGGLGVLLALGLLSQKEILSENSISGSPDIVNEDQLEQEQSNSVAEQVQVLEPQSISIPKINVSAAVESVGEDNSGKMDVPKGVFNAGWYNLGYKPGEKGSAVMAGHLDTITGAPAVFYNIGKLQAGDQVIVTDKDGKNLIFEVTDVETYSFDKVPLQEVFGSDGKPRLNLITCTGTWNTGSRNYSNRLVVYTELKS